LVGAAWGVEHSRGIWKLSDEQTILPMPCGAGSLPWRIAVLFYRDSCGGMRQTPAFFCTADCSRVLIILLTKASDKIRAGLVRPYQYCVSNSKSFLLHVSQRKCSLKQTDTDLQFELQFGREARAGRPNYCPHLTFCPFRLFLARRSWHACTELLLAMLK
jgi:hypothetical protein